MIGKKLLVLRKKKNLSQEELAEKVGVSRQLYQIGNQVKQAMI